MNIKQFEKKLDQEGISGKDKEILIKHYLTIMYRGR